MCVVWITRKDVCAYGPYSCSSLSVLVLFAPLIKHYSSKAQDFHYARHSVPRPLHRQQVIVDILLVVCRHN